VKNILIVLVIALLATPALVAPTYLGGDYGKVWLQNFGNKNVVPQSSGLWDWGNLPKGQMLVNGKLMEPGPGYLINPNSALSPIVLDEVTPSELARRMNTSQISNNTNLLEDPWYIAASTERPVLVKVGPY
jgi:hypothetical protein